MRAERLFLVDTSAWLWALREPGVREIMERLDELLGLGEVACVGMVELELLGGTRNEQEYSDLADTLKGLWRLATTEQHWRDAACLGFQLRRKGITVAFTDLLIATVALSEGAVVLHADEDFDLIASQVPLRVESYVEAVRG